MTVAGIMTHSGRARVARSRDARSPFRRASLPPVSNRTRAFAAVGAGLLLLALNVVDAADRGASAGNIVAIACGAFLLFWGFAMVARTGPPPSA